MRALVLEKFGDLAVNEIDSPHPGAGEVLIRVHLTGICGSDLHGYTGASGRRVPGQVMGHETVGRIAAAGADTEFEVGTLVTVNPVVGCGNCAPCRQGYEQYCGTKRVIGVDASRPAAFADYLLAPAANTITLAEDMPEAYGALIEPLAVGYHAAVRGSIGNDDSVLVIGGGPIGQAAVLGAQRLGATRIVVSEPSRGRRQLCEQLGATVCDPQDGPVAEQVSTLFGKQATVAIDAVGNDATIADALTSTPLGGTVVLVGMAVPQAQLDTFAVSTGERCLIGSFSYTAREFADVATWVSTAPHVLAALVDKTVPLEQAGQAFADLAAGTDIPGKILVRF